jgi:hypothetical protein
VGLIPLSRANTCLGQGHAISYAVMLNAGLNHVVAALPRNSGTYTSV